MKSLNSASQRLLGIGFRDMSPEERRVIEHLIRRSVTARNPPRELSENKTFGQRLADRVAAVGGSWNFIVGFGMVLAVWVAGNSLLMTRLGLHPFDPYPYIFLNLLLSMLAALQAPVIMMSQNRQAAKDRLAAEHDYEINLKAELEIMGLHEKLDGLRTRELADLMAQQIALLQTLRQAGRGAGDPAAAL
ncbi:MAG: DUF1003 domain-containing protein [Phenylobacterium sp.]|nr:MAG: DUF1003 domain-containing protein [Phenylobacterium sp.]